LIPAFFQITLKLFLIDNEGRLLILRDRKSGLGDLPGGRLGKGEIYNSWMDSLNREIIEELGSDIEYTVSEDPIFCFPHYMISDQCEGLGIAYTGKFIKGSIVLSDEHDYMEWADPESYSFENLYRDHMLDAVLKFTDMRTKNYGK